jgi:hypothetical protein
MKSDNKLIGTGLLTAITASLCCITPVLALIGGTSGIASTFSWIEPFRPYLIGLTFLVLRFAWNQKLKPRKEIDCECEMDEKLKFIQSKIFFRNCNSICNYYVGFSILFENFLPENGKTNNHSRQIRYFYN